MAKVSPEKTAPPPEDPASESPLKTLALPTSSPSTLSLSACSLPKTLTDFYSGMVEEHNRVLKEHRAFVAILTHDDFDVEFPPDSDMEVSTKATLTYFGEPRKLFIVCLKDRDPSRRTIEDIPCVQLGSLKEKTRKYFTEGKTSAGPFIWPLMSRDVAKAIAACETHSFLGAMGAPRPWWKRMLTAMQLWLPENSRGFIEVLFEHVDPATAYLIARGNFFAQKLWFLGVWAVLALIMRDALGDEKEEEYVAFVIFKVGLIIWGIVLAFTGRNRSAILVPEDADLKRAGKKLTDRVLCVNPSFSKAKTSKYKLIAQAIPASLFLILVVGFTLYLVTTLSIYLVYEWGECLERGCRDPQHKHGFWGWCAEVGLDILLAILFELFFAISSALSMRIAECRGFERLLDHEFSIEMFSIMLSTIERIGTFGIIAFGFTPQWDEPSPAFAKGLKVDTSRDCSDLVLKNSDIRCFHRKLSAKTRQHVFEKSFKGPFCVAPFVGIIIKSLIPYVAMMLDAGANVDMTSHLEEERCCCCRCCEKCLDGFFHLLALIFMREGGNVGCFKYVFRGWPFEDITLVDLADDTPEAVAIKPVKTDPEGVLTAPAETAVDEISTRIPDQSSLAPQGEQQPLTDARGAKPETTVIVDEIKESRMSFINDALAQSTRKPWEPMCELLEMKLSFLWIMFFGPIMPLGIIPTLAARVIETRTDVAKMLFVRARIFPEPDVLMHYTQTTFQRAVVFGSVGWLIALSLLTYNDDLYKWSFAARSASMVVTVVWALTTLALMMRPLPKVLDDR